MIPAPSPPKRRRPYRRSGLYARQALGPEVQRAMADLRAAFIADKGGPESISTAESVLIDLAVAAALKHEAVARYLLTLPSLVDRRHRRVWQVVRDTTALASHLQSLLRDLGLERRQKLTMTIEQWLHGDETPPKTPAATGSQTAT